MSQNDQKISKIEFLYRDLKMVEVSTRPRYITEKNLLEWENGLVGDSSVKRSINQSESD